MANISLLIDDEAEVINVNTTAKQKVRKKISALI